MEKLCVSFTFCLLVRSLVASVMKATPEKGDVADKPALQNTTELQHYFTEREAFYCPTEFFRDISFSSKSCANESLFCKAGESITVRCDAHGDWWSFSLRDSPEDYTVYPDSIRKCQPNGTWSGPRPFCVNTNENIRTNKIRVNPRKTTECHPLEKACLGEWTQIGEFLDACRPSIDPQRSSSMIKDGIPADFSFIFQFNRKTFLSFLTLSNITSSRLLTISVYVKNEDVISTFSKESLEFQRTFCHKWKNTHGKKERQCVVSRLEAFTDQLKVNFSLIPRESQRTDEPTRTDVRIFLTDINFYSILERCITASDNNSCSKLFCPKPPKIPNAESSQTIVSGVESVRYDCLSSYTAIDPIDSHSVHSFNLRCIDGDWKPYPFPVCRKRVAPVNSESALTEEESKQGLETSSGSEFEKTKARSTYSNRPTQIENLYTTWSSFSTIDKPVTKTVESSVNSIFNSTEIYYITIIGLLASSLSTLIIFITNRRFRRCILSHRLTRSRNSSSLISGSQIENSTIRNNDNYVCTSNTEDLLLVDLKLDEVHVYEELL